MINRLQVLFDRLEKDRIFLQDKIRNVPDGRFNLSSGGRWSIHQILAHLIAAEKISLQYMRKKVLGIDEAGNSGLVEEGKMMLLWFSQRLPFKFKAPGAVIDATPSYANVEQLIADWEHERRELASFLENFTDEQIKKKIYRHIRAGRLNIRHALLFYREHYLHHLPQIKKLLE